MSYIPFEFITHTRRVKILYKSILRDIQSWTDLRHDYRIQAVLMRAKFEANRHVKDPIVAKQLVLDAEKTFRYIRHPDPIRMPTSYQGTAWDRVDPNKPLDAMLDYWHPLEKAQYPDYFARREKRKKEFVEWYDKTYGKPPFEYCES